jgi:NADPH2:quinone reductase
MTLPSDMHAIGLDAPGGPEVLQPRRMPVPNPGPGEVLIRVAAAGVNAPDLQQRRGNYDPPPWHSPLIGLEVAGEIAAIGEGVTGWQAGSEVVALCNGGGYAEYVAVPAGQMLPRPQGWSWAEAAALPETFFTIMQTLVMRAGLEPGMAVLVHGGAGGIGGAAIVIATALGAHAMAVVSSAEKAAYATGLGAVATIDRTHEDFVARARELTGGRGADRIVDVVGGEVTARNLRAAAHGGHILLIGTLGSRTAELPLGLILVHQLTISGSVLRPQSNETKAAIAGRLRTHIWPRLAAMPRPRVKTVALTDAAAAHRSMEASDHYGKTILVTALGERHP